MCKLVSSANNVVSNLETLGKSFTYNKNSIGRRTEPCGTPYFTEWKLDVFSLNLVQILRIHRSQTGSKH